MEVAEPDLLEHVEHVYDGFHYYVRSDGACMVELMRFRTDQVKFLVGHGFFVWRTQPAPGARMSWLVYIGDREMFFRIVDALRTLSAAYRARRG